MPLGWKAAQNGKGASVKTQTLKILQGRQIGVFILRTYLFHPLATYSCCIYLTTLLFSSIRCCKSSD